ncbi:Hypothetical protein I595_3303 [Croceitalea dokdonensis DOKDO 023]|uniref:Uncharacterized protein n=1 Tax=Croceitalea dokdonensis DOKDO 023 TaxID=1300341 RepID=A0A0P7AZ41_9FLAO|nr:hypothetical protein [Croceitalea dokdonensis]KPM30227.1 Hypothetical protein I595_3704 [Croceitalea dokdonensis DOKDO 023]KPM30806.1 Hypothetical protein I595_3303 [Croceitalea dokdonensis DOKDO 023]
MNAPSYELVLDQKKSKYDVGLSQKFYWTGIAGIGILLIVIKIFESYDINIGDTELFNYVMIGLFISVGIGWLYGLFAYNGENRIIRGFITFDENEITINHSKKFQVADMTNIEFNVYDFKGRGINFHSDGDANRSYGGNNFISFDYQDKRHKFQFVADSKKHKDLLTKELMDKIRSNARKKY